MRATRTDVARAVVAVALAAFGVVVPLVASAESTPDDVCATLGLAELLDRPSSLTSPCVVAHDAPVAESGYYQNASRVGGTALASYPDVRLRYGLDPTIEVFADAPSAIAKSGQGGKGIYTSEQAGYGLKWLAGETTRVDYGLHAEVTPPNTATAIMDAKERYDVGLDSALLLAPRVSLGTDLDLDDGRRFGRAAASDLALREGLSLGYSVTDATRIAAEAVTESGSRHDRARAHSVGDVFVQQGLSKRAMFDVELGSSFDAIRGGSKPHYLGSGVAFKV